MTPFASVPATERPRMSAAARAHDWCSRLAEAARAFYDQDPLYSVYALQGADAIRVYSNHLTKRVIEAELSHDRFRIRVQGIERDIAPIDAAEFLYGGEP